MPKQSRYEAKKVVGRITHKHRIGTRKNGRPAHEMSEGDLRAALQGRYRSNAMKALVARGLTV